ncbi:MAG: type II secretory pathway predicted ATPase ExeA, partial [Francisellaceae bacterium]
LLTLWLVGHTEFLQRLSNERFGAIRSRVRILHEMQPIKDFQMGVYCSAQSNVQWANTDPNMF